MNPPLAIFIINLKLRISIFLLHILLNNQIGMCSFKVTDEFAVKTFQDSNMFLSEDKLKIISSPIPFVVIYNFFKSKLKELYPILSRKQNLSHFKLFQIFKQYYEFLYYNKTYKSDTENNLQFIYFLFLLIYAYDSNHFIDINSLCNFNLFEHSPFILNKGTSSENYLLPHYHFKIEEYYKSQKISKSLRNIMIYPDQLCKLFFNYFKLKFDIVKCSICQLYFTSHCDSLINKSSFKMCLDCFRFSKINSNILVENVHKDSDYIEFHNYCNYTNFIKKMNKDPSFETDVSIYFGETNFSAGQLNHYSFINTDNIDTLSSSNDFSIYNNESSGKFLNYLKQKKNRYSKFFEESHAYLERESRKRDRESERNDGNENNFIQQYNKSAQCFGPTCTNEIADGSKFCCRECGIQLALSRIEKYLPLKKLEWKDDPIVSHRNQITLLKLEKDIDFAKKRINELNQDARKLEFLLSHVNSLPIITYREKIDDDNDELVLDCPTCGLLFPIRKAEIHFEKCWTKLESTMSYGSPLKLDGADIFCDKYVKKYNIFCKKLKVICPEHNKDHKSNLNEICGCPLTPTLNISSLTCFENFKYCQLQKKYCKIHYMWAKLCFASIDQEKLMFYIKIDKLDEKRKLLKGQMASRGNLIALLLHSTIHEQL